MANSIKNIIIIFRRKRFNYLGLVFVLVGIRLNTTVNAHPKHFSFFVNSISLNGVNEEKQPYIVILKLNVSTNLDDLYQSHLSWITSSSISSLSNTRSITNEIICYW